MDRAIKRPAHLRSLTGMRFMAAMLVVLLHSAQRFEGASGLTSVVGFGYTGVSFFFILSGFVLAWTQRSDDTPGRFYWRRFARIWPLHALTTLLAIIVGLLVGLPVIWQALPSVLTLTQAWIPEFKYAFNGPSWSLSCELFFYLLFPVMIRPLSKAIRPIRSIFMVMIGMVVVGGACAVIFPVSQLGNLLYTLPLYRIGEFAIGVLLALAIQRGWRPRFTLLHATVGTVLMYAAIMGATLVVLGDPERLPYFVADLWMLPGFVAIIAAGAAGDLRGDAGFVRSDLVVRLGQWSFALYLVHEIVLKAAAPIVGDAPPAIAYTAVAIVVVISVAASGILYEWFERPIEKKLRGLLPQASDTKPAIQLNK